MSRRTYTDAEKAAALALYEAEGPTAVQTQMGISKGTVAGWARKTGTQTRSLETANAGVRRSAATMEQRKLNLASGLMDDIERLRGQLWVRCVERKALVVSQGRDEGSSIEIADIEHEQPTFGDQKSIMTSIAIAIDKVQILTGEATEVTKHLGGDARDRLAEVRDELAARRADKVA